MRRILVTSVVAVVGIAATASSIASAGTFPGDDGRIAFARPSGIWLVDADGSNAELVIPDAFTPRISPDGSRITYTRFGPDFADIFVADLDGANEVRITSWGENLQPTFSADGGDVIWVRGGSHTDLVMKAADGTGSRTRLTDTRQLDEFLPAASADGTSIAYSGARGAGDFDIYAIDADGGNRRRLTDSARPELETSWSPDSSRIAFTRIGGVHPTIDDVFVMDADGGNVERLTESPRADSVAAFSPEGSRILIVRCCWGARERPRLALIDADGSDLTPLGRFGFDADWQPLD